MFQPNQTVRCVPWGTYICRARIVGYKVFDGDVTLSSGRTEKRWEINYKIQLIDPSKDGQTPIEMEVPEYNLKELVDWAEKSAADGGVPDRELSRKESIYRSYLIKAFMAGNPSPMSYNMYFEG